jgi:hypothetical protein
MTDTNSGPGSAGAAEAGPAIEQAEQAIDKVGASPATSKLHPPPPQDMAREIGGRDGPEPTRFGDWEKAGRCIDF